MKTSILLLSIFALVFSLRAGEETIYPNGFQTNLPPYYCVYARQRTNGWGWAPDTNGGNTTFTATYSNNVHGRLQFIGKNGDTASIPTNSITIPAPPYSPTYRWTVYFDHLSDIPRDIHGNPDTNGAPLTLRYFGP